MSWFSQRRETKEQQRKADEFVRQILREPEDGDARWLAAAAMRGDLDHARWELRYARRALGLIAAERDALDDRTASIVAHALSDALPRDPNIAPDMLETAERQFNARLSAYRDGLDARGEPGTDIRMGQTLFAFSGAALSGDATAIHAAGALLARYLAEANAALRASFGKVSLPDDVPPSALIPG
jgi:hypothetical protein